MTTSVVELFNLYEQALAMPLNRALPILQGIVSDPLCPKDFKVTVERTISQLTGNTTNNKCDKPTEIEKHEPKEETTIDSPNCKNREPTTLLYVNVNDIQPIKHIEELMPISDAQYARLKSSIKKSGIQVPLFVTPDMKLLAGYNRLKIAKELGLDEVPVIVKDVEAMSMSMVEFAIRDNIDRRQLSMKEVAQIVAKLDMKDVGRPAKRERSRSIKEVAKLLNVSPSSISRAKAYLKKVATNPSLSSKEVNAVVARNKSSMVKAMTFEFIDGVSLNEDALVNEFSKVIDTIFTAIPTKAGDKIKVVVQIWHITKNQAEDHHA